MKATNLKMVCEECGWVGRENELLTAENPFRPEDMVTGCPKCKSLDTIRAGCDEPGCDEIATCGTPTEKGYRMTCGYHVQIPKVG